MRQKLNTENFQNDYHSIEDRGCEAGLLLLAKSWRVACISAFYLPANVNPIYAEHLSEGQLVDEAQGCQLVDTGKRIAVLDLADTPRCNEVVHNLRFLSEALA